MGTERDITTNEAFAPDTHQSSASKQSLIGIELDYGEENWKQLDESQTQSFSNYQVSIFPIFLAIVYTAPYLLVSVFEDVHTAPLLNKCAMNTMKC